jgi:sulfite dehydrogenase
MNRGFEDSRVQFSRLKPRNFGLKTWLTLSACGLACLAASVKIELPTETGSFKPGPGAEIANGQCLVCHSVEYVTTQPPLPRAFWASSVKKMQEKYGAAIPGEQIEPLLDYLTRHYGVETTNNPSSSEPKPAPTPTATALTGDALATKYGCVGCHNVSVKIVGPPYKDLAAKYRNDQDAFRKISEQIHKGGSGKWGPVIMPPFPQVSEAETKALADWILKAK